MPANQKTWEKITRAELDVLKSNLRSKGLVPPSSDKSTIRGRGVVADCEYNEQEQTLLFTPSWFANARLLWQPRPEGFSLGLAAQLLLGELGQLVLDRLLVGLPALFLEVGPAHADHLGHGQRAEGGQHGAGDEFVGQFHGVSWEERS